MTSINVVRESSINFDAGFVKAVFINGFMNSVGSIPGQIHKIHNKIFIYHYVNSTLHDYLHNPAMQCFVGNKVKETNRYKLGRLNDADEFNPALVEWFDDGKIKLISRYKNGLANNSKNGLPARQEFFASGNVKSCSYYEDNLLNDYNGIPAFRYWNDNGYVVICDRYSKGEKL